MKKTVKSSVNNSVKTSDNSDAKKRQLAGLKPFKPGQSGNPGGRPKGKRDFNTLVDLAIEALALDYVRQTNEQGRKKKGYIDISLEDVDIEADIFKQFMNKARNGDIKAIDSFLDRRHGKAKQPIEVSGIDGDPIKHAIQVKEFEESIINEQDKWFEDSGPAKVKETPKAKLIIKAPKK